MFSIYSATQLRLGISHLVALRHKRLGQFMDATVSQSFLPLLNVVKTNEVRGHEVNLDHFSVQTLHGTEKQ